MLAKIHITLKKDVLDPQGSVIANSLKSLGFENVKDVRQGKFIELEINSNSKEEAEKQCNDCLLYTSPSPRDGLLSRMPSSA